MRYIHMLVATFVSFIFSTCFIQLNSFGISLGFLFHTVIVVLFFVRVCKMGFV